MRKPVRVAVGVGLALSLALAACGGDGDEPPLPGDDDESPTTGQPTLTMIDNEFQPSTLTIGPSELRIVNEGQAPHTFTLEDGSIDVELEPGDSTTETIEAVGTQKFECRFHPGMEGTLVVADA